MKALRFELFLQDSSLFYSLYFASKFECLAELMDKKIDVYFAGALFSSKDLIGNCMLAESIEEISGKYRIVLPQDIEVSRLSPKEIRDGDIRALLNCDMAIFNFDGTDLDSGTVAEFMIAKFAAKPALLLRTDFRSSGDQNVESSGFEPWNLMLSFYPQTQSLLLNAADIYRQSFEGGRANLKKYADLIALKVVEKLDGLLLSEHKFERENKDILDKWLCGALNFKM